MNIIFYLFILFFIYTYTFIVISHQNHQTHIYMYMYICINQNKCICILYAFINILIYILNFTYIQIGIIYHRWPSILVIKWIHNVHICVFMYQHNCMYLLYTFIYLFIILYINREGSLIVIGHQSKSSNDYIYIHIFIYLCSNQQNCMYI
jgi:hypothetical protein